MQHGEIAPGILASVPNM